MDDNVIIDISKTKLKAVDGPYYLAHQEVRLLAPIARGLNFVSKISVKNNLLI